MALCVAVFATIEGQPGAHATHTLIVLSRTMCALLFFAQRDGASRQRRLGSAAPLAAGLLLHRFWPVSKIGATPPWGLYCAAICTSLFGALYWLMEARARSHWAALVGPAATSPLVTYLIALVLAAVMGLLQLRWDAALTRAPARLRFRSCLQAPSCWPWRC